MTLAPLHTWRSSIAESGLPANARHVALTLALHMNERGGSCFPKIATLAREMGRHRDTVQQGITILIEEGYLQREERSGTTPLYSASLPNRALLDTPPHPEGGGLEDAETLVTPPRNPADPPEGTDMTPPPGPAHRGVQEETIREEPAHISASAERMADAYNVRPLVAHYFDTAKKLGVVVPQTNAPLLVHRIQDCLDAGATERQVKGGIELMVAKGMAPQSLAYFVTEFSSQHRPSPTRTEDHWWEHVDEEKILSPEENAARARLIAQGRYEQAAATPAASTADSPSSPSPEPASATETFSPSTPTMPPSGESDEPAHPTIPSGQTDTGD